MRLLAIKLIIVITAAILTILFGLALVKLIQAPNVSIMTKEMPIVEEAESKLVSQRPSHILADYLKEIPERPPSSKSERSFITEKEFVRCVMHCDDSLGGKPIKSGQIVFRTPPVMPKDVTHSGSCIFDVHVGEEGRVKKIKNMECSDKVFESASEAAAFKWVFYPKIISGKAVPFVSKAQKIQFYLMDEQGRIIPEP